MKADLCPMGLIYTVNPPSESNDFQRLLEKSGRNEGKCKVFQRDPLLFVHIRSKKLYRDISISNQGCEAQTGDAVPPDHRTNDPQSKSALKSMAKNPSKMGKIT